MTYRPKFTSTEHAENPSKIFDELRGQGHLARIKLPIIGKVWMTTSHAATSTMLKDDQRFTLRNPAKGGKVVGMRWWMPRTISLLADNMLTSDREDHRRLRKLVDQAFQRQKIGDMEKRVREIANNLLDRVEGQPKFDLVTTYARELPLAVICELLGVDEARRQSFSDEAGKFAKIAGMMDIIRAIRSLRRMTSMLEDMISEEQVRQLEGRIEGNAGDGLIAGLVRAELEGDKLSRTELVAMIFLLLMAGHETTTHAISTAVLSLHQNREQRDWLFEDVSHFDMAIEELLRFNSSVQFSKPRYICEGGDFFGAELAKGEVVMACLGAANRDPQHFDNPEALDLTRRPNPHLEFGTGIHFCLGFQLARLEIKTALQVLYERYPNLQLVDDNPRWMSRLGMRALKELWVRG